MFTIDFLSSVTKSKSSPGLIEVDCLAKKIDKSNRRLTLTSVYTKVLIVISNTTALLIQIATASVRAYARRIRIYECNVSSTCTKVS